MSRRKQARPIRHLESEDGLVSALPNGKYTARFAWRCFFFPPFFFCLPRGAVKKVRLDKKCGYWFVLPFTGDLVFLHLFPRESDADAKTRGPTSAVTTSAV